MFKPENYNTLFDIKNEVAPCVSLFIPTYRSGNNQEDRLRFKNANCGAIIQLTD